MIDGAWITAEEKEECAKAGRPIGLARGTINGRIGRIKMMFNGPPSNSSPRELCSARCWRSMDSRKEDRRARETEAVTPLALDLVEKTLSLLPPVVPDVVHIERHRLEKQAILGMEFKTFINAFLRVPCQIVRMGRRWIYRVLSGTGNGHSSAHSASNRNAVG